MPNDPDEIEWMVLCPDCYGNGICGMCERDCRTCNGEGEVPRRE